MNFRVGRTPGPRVPLDPPSCCRKRSPKEHAVRTRQLARLPPADHMYGSVGRYRPARVDPRPASRSARHPAVSRRSLVSWFAVPREVPPPAPNHDPEGANPFMPFTTHYTSISINISATYRFRARALLPSTPIVGSWDATLAPARSTSPRCSTRSSRRCFPTSPPANS